MTMASAYLFNIPGNPTVQISKDELRLLLRDIESELHRSKVYRLAVANVQKLVGSSEEQAKNLFKAVGREAITLAFKQFAQKNAVDTVTEIPVLEHSTELHPLQEEQSSDLSPTCKNQESNPQLEVANTTPITEQKIPTKTPIKWLWQNQKLSKRQISAQILAEQRLESLHQIGEQLKQARTSQGLTLQKLNIYTHISVHQMEAVENANFDLLPEDILIRGFIRIMANALGLNGTILANSLPVSNQSKSVVPSWDQNRKSPGQLNLEISPAHLYIGYTTLVAGAVGGLSLISQQANYQTMHNSQVIIPTSSSLCESTQKTQVNTQTEINSRKPSVCLGSNISPPEAL